MSITVHDLFDKPDHYLFAFEDEHALFVTMDREAYHNSIFLDSRIKALDRGELAVEAEAIAEWRDDQRLPIPTKGWIFHVANCGSTLLARALDRLRDDLVLREPLALRQLGVDHAGMPASGRDAWDARLRLTAHQLGKRFRPEAPVIVKANVPVNFILPQLMALDPSAPSILLYYPLRDYLMAIIRSDQHRQWVMRVTDELRPALDALFGPIGGLSIAERAAALWLGQLVHFDAALKRYPKVHSLDAATLFGQSRATIAASAELFGVAMAEAQLDAVMGSTLFTTYSKDPTVQFDESARRARAVELEASLAPEIEAARQWVVGKSGRHPLPERLSRPLVGEAPALL